MVCRVGEQKEQHGDEGCEDCESFPSADFGGPGHRWIECTRRSDCHEDSMVRFSIAVSFRNLVLKNDGTRLWDLFP
jgi:hypothetical protein